MKTKYGCLKCTQKTSNLSYNKILIEDLGPNSFSYFFAIMLSKNISTSIWLHREVDEVSDFS